MDEEFEWLCGSSVSASPDSERRNCSCDRLILSACFCGWTEMKYCRNFGQIICKDVIPFIAFC